MRILFIVLLVFMLGMFAVATTSFAVEDQGSDLGGGSGADTGDTAGSGEGDDTGEDGEDEACAEGEEGCEECAENEIKGDDGECRKVECPADVGEEAYTGTRTQMLTQADETEAEWGLECRCFRGDITPGFEDADPKCVAENESAEEALEELFPGMSTDPNDPMNWGPGWSEDGSTDMDDWGQNLTEVPKEITSPVETRDPLVQYEEDMGLRPMAEFPLTDELSPLTVTEREPEAEPPTMGPYPLELSPEFIDAQTRFEQAISEKDEIDASIRELEVARAAAIDNKTYDDLTAQISELEQERTFVDHERVQAVRDRNAAISESFPIITEGPVIANEAYQAALTAGASEEEIAAALKEVDRAEAADARLREMIIDKYDREYGELSTMSGRIERGMEDTIEATTEVATDIFQDVVSNDAGRIIIESIINSRAVQTVKEVYEIFRDLFN